MKYNHQKLYEEIIKLSLNGEKIKAFLETRRDKYEIKSQCLISYVRIIEKWGLSHFKKNSSILDIGAGAGRISLYLKKNNYTVTALERSRYLCEVMRKKGIKKVIHKDVFDYYPKIKYKQIILVNSHPFGSKLASVEKFFSHISDYIIKDSGKLMIFFSKTKDSKNRRAKRRYIINNKIGEWEESVYPSINCFIEIAEKYGFKREIFDIDGKKKRYFLLFKKIN